MEVREGTKAKETVLQGLDIFKSGFVIWKNLRQSSAAMATMLGFLGLLTLQLLAIPLEDWKQAEPGFNLSFPKDHASHPGYKIEWWYYTGNLLSKTGEHFGFQLTFFRIGIDLRPANPSRWAVRDLFMAHFAITDISRKKYHFSERMNRSGVGWAGASSESYHVWNQGWEVRLDERGDHHLIANDPAIRLDLTLSPGKAPVLHGEKGFSQKGRQSANASLYYSLTRMPTSGQLTSEGKSYSVEGLSWMDHEFGTSFLEEGQAGWDWFSIQLEDGTELMLFQLRRTDGRTDSHSSGTWVDASGHATPLQLRDFEMKGAQYWQSNETGIQYPTKWEIQCAPLRLQLIVQPVVLDQELRTKESTGVNYWEGAVEITGTREGKPVKGRGYLEMTGYGGQVMSHLFGK